MDTSAKQPSIRDLVYSLTDRELALMYMITLFGDDPRDEKGYVKLHMLFTDSSEPIPAMPPNVRDEFLRLTRTRLMTEVVTLQPLALWQKTDCIGKKDNKPCPNPATKQIFYSPHPSSASHVRCCKEPTCQEFAAFLAVIGAIRPNAESIHQGGPDDGNV